MRYKIVNESCSMNSQTAKDKNGIITKAKTNLQDLWSNLSENQQSILKKIWSILTYKWQWQIILNAPFLVIWALDQTIPAVHTFDMQLISSLPIPKIIKLLINRQIASHCFLYKVENMAE